MGLRDQLLHARQQRVDLARRLASAEEQIVAIEAEQCRATVDSEELRAALETACRRDVSLELERRIAALEAGASSSPSSHAEATFPAAETSAATEISAPAEAPVTAEPSSGRQTAAWEQSPISVSALTTATIEELVARLEAVGSGFVLLGAGVSSTLLREALPPPWAVQPDDLPLQDLVLVYRRHRTVVPASTLRRAYLLVDLAAAVHPDGMLNEESFERLRAAIPQVGPALAAAQESMLARAVWRRAAPALQSDITLPPLALGDRRTVVGQLRSIVGASPAVWGKLTAVSRLLLGQSAGRRDLAAQPSLEPITPLAPERENAEREEPFEPVQLAPGPVPQAPETLPLETVDRTTLDEARERTRIAQGWLLSLEDPDPDSEEPTVREPTLELSARERMFAERLAERGRHSMRQVREIARSLGLIPLNAISVINDWAEQQGDATRSAHRRGAGDRSQRTSRRSLGGRPVEGDAGMNSPVRSRDRQAILTALRAGVVPRRGLAHLQVGRADEVAALTADIDHIREGGSAIRFVKGGFGAGKSFFLHVIQHVARQKNCVTMNADITQDARLYGTHGQVRRLFSTLAASTGTKSQPEGGAIAEVLEKFVASARDEARRTDNDVEWVVRDRLADLVRLAGGNLFADVVIAYWHAVRQGDEAKRAAALRWMRAEFTTVTEAKQALGVREIIQDATLLPMLELLALLVRKAGYAGLVVQLDEMGVLCRLQRPARDKNFEQILTVVNALAEGRAKHLMATLAGTTEFVESPINGLASYPALSTRLKVNLFAGPNLRDIKSPVLELPPLTREDDWVLLENLHRVYCSNSQRDPLPDLDVALKAFLDHSSAQLGGLGRCSPRELSHSWVGFLDVLDQNRRADWREVLNGVTIARDHEPERTPLDDVDDGAEEALGAGFGI